MWTIIATLVSLLAFIFTHIFTKELRHGIRELRNIQREFQHNNIDFFCEILSPKWKKGLINVFCDSLPKKNRINSNDRITIKKELKKSYLITGESGCGKSSFLRQDYNCNLCISLFDTNFPFFHPINYLSSFSLYLTANDLLQFDESKIKFIKEKLLSLPVKHTRLYLDGLDEMGEQFDSKIDIIKELIKTMKIVNKCEVKIACRRIFSNKKKCEAIFDEYNLFTSGYDLLEIDYWDSESLEEIAKKVLSNRNLKKTIKNQSIASIKKNKNWIKKFKQELRRKHKKVFSNAPTSDKCLVNSPLILMLFLYVNLFTSYEIVLSNKISKYELYDTFINAIGKNCGATSTEIQEEKKKLGKISFVHFLKLNKNDFERIKYTESSKIILLKKIIKNPAKPNIEVNFIHYSFLDFFIAFHYQTVLLDLTKDLYEYIEVLGADYQNDISDFITEALQLHQPNDEIAKNMCNIYDSLINKKITKKVSKQAFLSKKEIAFRLGRLWYSSDAIRKEISSFLKKIYFSDNDTYINDDFPLIHSTMLKRWIAIAGSLLHTPDGEFIEMDYIKKMICEPFGNNNLADEANRSQTLVFYGDVKGISALDYRDNIPETECINSVNKRVNRLLTINDKESYLLLNKNLNPRSADLKSYCFRAFDLSSIYCLLRYHGGTNILLKDALKNKGNIKIDNIRVTFQNANPEREKIMKLLIKALNTEILPEKICL